MARTVVALIHEEDGNYGISFPDFPGAVSAGKSADEAIERGAATLAAHVSGMIEDGEALPQLRSIEELRKDRSFHEDSEGGFPVLVPFDAPGRAVRINISMDEILSKRSTEQPTASASLARLICRTRHANGSSLHSGKVRCQKNKQCSDC